MAKGFNIQLKGLKETIKKLEAEADERLDMIDFAIGAGVEAMATEAKQRVPVGQYGTVTTAQGTEQVKVGGRLKTSISAAEVEKYNYELVAEANYAAYVEFGTGTGFVELPEQEWMELAAQFKGAGKRQVNLPARPYLRPSVNRITPIMLKDIQDIINEDARL